MMIQWKTFSAAPHRMMFFGGMLQFILTISWWLIELLGRYTTGWIVIQSVVPSTWVHPFLMFYGIFPFFIFGFLMTTYPRWMSGPLVPYRHYVSAWGFLFSSIPLIYIGLLTSKQIFMAGVLCVFIGWSIAFYALLQVYFRAPAKDKHYETVLNFALFAGWLGIFAYLLWLLTDSPLLLDFVRQGSVWLYLLPIMITVCHRMIPYFSSCALKGYRVVQPSWSLPLMGIGVVGHLFLEMLHLWGWRFIFDIPLMFLAFHHTFQWGFIRSFSIRLLAVLHIAFAWLGISLFLFNIQSITFLWSGQLLLGLAPLHALTIGFATSLIVGMASRVTLGHSGRALVANSLTWICFWGISLTALLRIVAELPFFNSLFGLPLTVWATCIGLLFLLPWTLYYLPMTVLPRVDGKPG